MTMVDQAISEVNPEDFERIVVVWEASVRATHHFLSEEWIQEHRPLIPKYLEMVELACIRDRAGTVIAFLGALEGNIEMLFIHPEHFRKGLGKTLINHAIKEQGATKVDVNEDNPEALKFYQTMGFEVTGRSELDGQGNPYPLLHMALTQKTGQ